MSDRLAKSILKENLWEEIPGGYCTDSVSRDEDLDEQHQSAIDYMFMYYGAEFYFRED